jgi:hypothetical protein
LAAICQFGYNLSWTPQQSAAQISNLLQPEKTIGRGVPMGLGLRLLDCASTFRKLKAPLLTPGISSFGFQIVYKDLLTHENVTVGNTTALYSF